jgi:hypothetical protein
MFSKTFWLAFSLVFLAELADRSRGAGPHFGYEIPSAGL